MGVWGLGSCSSQEDAELAQAGTHRFEVPVTVEVSVDDDLSRTQLDESFGNLKWSWDSGDCLLVTDAGGERLGSLNVKEVDSANPARATFSGSLSFDVEGVQELNIFYLGKGVSTLVQKSYTSDLSMQDGGIDDLVTRDLLATKVRVELNQRFIRIPDFSLSHYYSAARFELRFPEGMNPVVDEVTMSGEGLYNAVVVDLGTRATTPVEGTVTVYEKSDFYINMVPTEKVSVKFTVIDTEGREWSGVYAGRSGEGFAIKAGAYLRRNADFGGLIVELKLPEEPLKHDLNPLARWAESDLKQKSGTDGSDSESEFTGDYKITGSYYQFGRNKGYADYTDARSYYTVEKSLSPYNNVYDPFVYARRTSTYTASGHQFASYPQYFYIDAAHSGDYMSPNSEVWTDRAQRCGYDRLDPSPDGWRLPTLADYREILPTGGYNGLLSDLAEIKSFPDLGIRCAMQWSRVQEGGNQYMRIRSLVIPESVTTTDEVDWTDAHTVTRYFKAAGTVTSSWHQYSLTSQGVVSTQFVATPMPLCAFNAAITGASNSAQAVMYTITRSDMSLGGFYWMSDGEQMHMEFMFDPQNLRRYGSYIGVYDRSQQLASTAKPQPNAYNIRCIKAD